MTKIYSATQIRLIRNKISRIAKIKHRKRMMIMKFGKIYMVFCLFFVFIDTVIQILNVMNGLSLFSLTHQVEIILITLISIAALLFLKQIKNYPFIYGIFFKQVEENVTGWNENIIPQMRICAITNEFIYIYYKPKSYFILKKESDIGQFNEIKTILKSKRNRFCKYFEEN